MATPTSNSTPVLREGSFSGRTVPLIGQRITAENAMDVSKDPQGSSDIVPKKEQALVRLNPEDTPQRFDSYGLAARRISGNLKPIDLSPAINSDNTHDSSQKQSSPSVDRSQTPSQLAPSVLPPAIPVLSDDTNMVLEEVSLWLESAPSQTSAPATVTDDATYSKESDSLLQQHQMSSWPVRAPVQGEWPLDPKDSALTQLEPRRRDTPQESDSESVSDADERPHRLVLGWLTTCFIFMILAPITSIVLGIKVHTPDLDATTKPGFASFFSGRTVELTAILVSADPTSSTMVFDWFITGESGNSSCTSTSTTTDVCTNVNIYFDNNLLIGDSSSGPVTPTNDIPNAPVFIYNALRLATYNPLANTALFRTNVKVLTSLGKRSSLVHYPFDNYQSHIFMFGIDTNKTAVGLRITQSTGNAVGFTTTTNSSQYADGSIEVDISLQRGGLIRAFCVIIVISIWLITLALVVLTFTSIFFGFRQRVEILVVPVATIFSFTQLRASMPGAPEGFGDILDFVGILPCLAVLAFSAAASLAAFILRDPASENAKPLTWELLRKELRLWRRATHRSRQVTQKKNWSPQSSE